MFKQNRYTGYEEQLSRAEQDLKVVRKTWEDKEIFKRRTLELMDIDIENNRVKMNYVENIQMTKEERDLQKKQTQVFVIIIAH